MTFENGSPHVVCGSCGTLTRLAETTKAAEPTGRKFPMTILGRPAPHSVTGTPRVPKRVFIPEYLKYEHVCVTCSLDLSLGRTPRLRSGDRPLVPRDMRPRLVKQGG